MPPVIELLIRARDEATRELREMKEELKRFGMALTAMGAAGMAGFGLAEKAAADFDASLKRTAALTAATTEEMEALRQPIIDLSKEMPQSARELADGMFFVISATGRTSDAMEILEASAKAAAAGEEGLLAALDELMERTGGNVEVIA